MGLFLKVGAIFSTREYWIGVEGALPIIMVVLLILVLIYTTLEG